MILRRMADAIREQNWFTVIIEVLIVVVGIFIGLQVDDWNQSRKAERDSQLFLAELDEDIVGVISNIDSAIKEHQEWVDAGILALRYLNGENILADHQGNIEYALETMHQLPSPHLLNGHLAGVLAGNTGRILVSQHQKREVVDLASKIANRINIYRHVEREIAEATSINKKMIGFSIPDTDELTIWYDSEALRASAEFKVAMQNAIVFHVYAIRVLRVLVIDLKLYQKNRSNTE